MNKILSLLLLLTWIAQQIFASAIEVTPTKVFMNESQHFTFVTVKNLSDHKVFMQAEALDWQQKNNENMYSPSSDLIITPIIFPIEPKKEQIVRIGKKNTNNKLEEELSYRLLLSELPDQYNVSKGIKIMLRLNLPIFIQPKMKTELPIKWSKEKLKDNKIELSIYNPNNYHQMINKIELKDKLDKDLYKQQNAFIYLLPKQKHTWYINTDKSKENYNDLTMQIETLDGLQNAVAMNTNKNINNRNAEQQFIANIDRNKQQSNNKDS